MAQPPEIRARKSSEHWSADLYLRDLSPHLSRRLVQLGFSANAVTWVMIGCGAAAGLALLLPGPWGPVLAVVLTQVQMLVDAADGEVARWRNTFSPAGIFLDKVGHYTAEAMIPVCLGVRAAGGPGALDGHYAWTTLGAFLALLLVLNKALNDMVHVARAFTGLDRLPEVGAANDLRPGLTARLRRVARFVPFHRIFHSVELSLVVLAATLVGMATGVDQGDVAGAQWALRVLVPLAVLTVVGHLVSILASAKLRAAP